MIEPWRFLGYSAVGAWFLLGSVLKMAMLGSGHGPSEFVWESAWFIVPASFAELMIAIGLGGPWAPGLMRWLAAAALSAFMGIHLMELVGWIPPCHCFGMHHPQPWAMLIANAACLSLLLALRPPAGPTWRPLAFSTVLAALALLALAMAPTPLLAAPAASSQSGGPDAVAQSLSRLPDLRIGTWNVAFIRPSCQECMSELRTLALLAQTNAVNGGWVVINVDRVPATADGLGLGSVEGIRIINDPQDLIDTPLFLGLHDGVVMDRRTTLSP